MKLQQIKLSGFKSFVEATNIDVYGQLVGIVGPNGCGKSNVIDAVRWVLGESSARQLRGESMMDVIFNGSLKRKPVSRATVELVFDNSAKALNGLWNTYDEVSIKRLISRQGDSIYYINNQQVRRKDITDLFLGTGVGTRGYAVIEQGMISRIIESKPEEMRNFVEEAAGVSKYRERRKETLARLSDTADNLQRLEDIYSEVIKQLEELNEQAKVATHHQDLTNQLKDTQLLSLAVKISQSNSILSESNQFIKSCEEELQVFGYQLEEINNQLIDEQAEKSVCEESLQELVEKFNAARTNLARVEERYKHYSDLLRRFENESETLGQKEIEINAEIEVLNDKLIDIDAQLDEKQLSLSELSISREDLAVSLEDEETRVSEILEQFSSKQDVVNKLKHDLDLLNNSLNHKKQQLGNLQTRQAKLLEESNTLDFDENYHFIKEEIELLEDELSQCLITIEESQLRHENVNTELDEVRLQNNNENKQLASLQAKLEMLHQLLKSASSQDGAESDTQQVWQYLEIDVKYTKAIEAALGFILKTQLVGDGTDLACTQENKYGYWLNKDSQVKPDASSLAQYVNITDERLSGIYSVLNEFVLVENVQVKLPNNQTGVTLDGHLCTDNYVIYNVGYGEQNLLELNQQKNETEAELNLLQNQIEASENRLNELQQTAKSISNDIISLEAKHKRLIAKKHDLQLDFTKQEQIFLQNKRHKERIESELAIIQEDANILDESIESLEIKLDDTQIDYEEKLSANQDSELQKIEAETSLKLAKDRVTVLDSKINQLVIDNQILNQNKQHTKETIEDKKIQLSAAKLKLQELSQERDECKSSNQAQEIIELQQDIAEVARQMQDKQTKLDEISNKIIASKNKASSINSSYQRTQEKINQMRFKEQEQKILLSTYNEQLSDDELGLEQLAEIAKNCTESIEELTRKIKRIESEVESLGLVNLKAIEDLAKAQEKEKDLVTQVQDLNSAKATLEEAIAHIDNETRILLQDTFDKLNQAVDVYFKTLFGGGDAKLSLTEADILNAGVQIYAAPPGKKNATIHLLSGGEKALAAMSFIFALFSLNPAPFCLLDEVDAPLDDANTQRFCNLVGELSSKTQFVYISHNRLAMEMADQLVGVTMQEKGVSTVVSVSLVDAIKHVEENKAQAVN